jgi:hypothetical protein
MKQWKQQEIFKNETRNQGAYIVLQKKKQEHF